MILSQGFRPFFLAASAWAGLSLFMWVLSFADVLVLPVSDPLQWHVHEMLFGYTSAAVVGFILTAIPNWTKRLPVQGGSLAWLVVLWGSGRIAILMQGEIANYIVMTVDVSFLICVFLIVVREIVAGKNWRNLPIALALGLYAASNLVDHLAAMELFSDPGIGQRMGLSVIIMLIALIGGRVIPSFTGNWLKKQGAPMVPSPFSGFDKVCLLVLLTAQVLWISLPDHAATGWLMILAGICHGVRMSRWCGYATFSDTLVLVLHMGYGWLVLGVVFMGSEILWPETTLISGIHAMTAGGIGTMTLAMMTRASLGHAGQGLVAGPGTITIYVMVTIGAVLRVAAPVFPADLFTDVLFLSAIAWGGAFVLFFVIYAPLLAGMKPTRSS